MAVTIKGDERWELRPRGTERERVRSRNGSLRCKNLRWFWLEVRGGKFEIRGIWWNELLLVCVCIVLLLLSLSIFDFFSLSKPESLFLSLLIHGFMGLIFHGFDSWVHAISWLLIHGFMGLIFLVSGCWWFFWVHGFDYLLRESIKEKKILIILIFREIFHLLFCRTWRTVLGSLAFVLGLLLFWVCSWFWVLFLVFLGLMEIRFGCWIWIWVC